MTSTSPKHGKRSRSPSLTEQPARRGRALSHEPCQTPCGCPASREVRRLEARVAELEAELQRKTALLTDDFHENYQIQELRRQIEPDDGAVTYAAATLRAAWRERISDAFVERVRDLQVAGADSYYVDRAFTASWCIRHAVVPHLVSSSVVMPFLKRDVVVVGACGLGTTICVNAPAPVLIDVLESFVGQARTRSTLAQLPVGNVLADLCAARLPKSELTRLLAILELVGSDEEEHPLGLLRAWCLFRLGKLPLDAFVSLDPYQYEFQRLLRSDEATEEFFLPAASRCTLDQLDDFSRFLSSADPNKIAAPEIRDGFFCRLAKAPGMDRERMADLCTRLMVIVRNSDVPNAAFFFEPEFVLDWAPRALAFCSSASAGDTLAAPLCRFFRMASRKWPTPLVQRALDTFLLPAVSCIHFDDASWLAWCLRTCTYGDPAVSGARLFCTTVFRDRFFIALYRGGRNRNARNIAEPIADSLMRITAAVPRAQRQAVFATAEFRDEVLVRLIECAADRESVTVAARAAFLNIAENEDGSLHAVFMGDACRASILEPLQSERSGSLTSAQLFENIREAQGAGR